MPECRAGDSLGSQPELAWVQVCERRECKGKMTNVIARKRCMLAGDSFQLAKHRHYTQTPFPWGLLTSASCTHSPNNPFAGGQSQNGLSPAIPERGVKPSASMIEKDNIRRTEGFGLLWQNRLSNNVGSIEHFLGALVRALGRARHFALVDTLAISNSGPPVSLRTVT